MVEVARDNGLFGASRMGGFGLVWQVGVGGTPWWF